MQKKLRYTNLQISMHWLTATLLIITIALPFLHNAFTDANLIFTIHKSLGLIIFTLTVVRIFLIKKQGAPELLDDSHRMQRALSKAVQGLLYLLLIIMPLSGYLMGNHSIDFLGVLDVPALTLPIELRKDLHVVHHLSAFMLIGLIGLHALAALYHHYIVKDNVLKAMLFSKK